MNRPPIFAAFCWIVCNMAGPPCAGSQCSSSSPTTKDTSPPSIEWAEEVICWSFPPPGVSMNVFATSRSYLRASDPFFWQNALTMRMVFWV